MTTATTTKRSVLGLFLILSIVVCKIQAGNLTVTQVATFTIAINDRIVGNFSIGLFGQTVPKTVKNFVAFASGKGPNGLGYKGNDFHRVINKFVVQGGDVVNHDGTGFTSIYGDTFADENFTLKHYRGFVNMANKGVNTNGCQFAILTVDAPWLDGKHCVFGKIIDGMNVVARIENLPTNGVDHPIPRPVIAESSVVDVAVPYDVTTA